MKDVDRRTWDAGDWRGPLTSLSCQINITSAQNPSPGPFSIDEQGLLRAPSQGLRGQAQKVNVALDLGMSMDWVEAASCEKLFVFDYLD